MISLVGNKIKKTGGFLVKMVNLPIDINWAGGMAKAMYWLGYGLLVLIIIGGMFAIYLIMGYKYKVTIMQRGGTGKESEHSINKIRRDRGKEVTVKGVKKFKLLLSRKVIQPVDYKYMYPGNNIYLYKSGPEAFHPMKLNCSTKNDGNFEQIPSDVSFWMGLTLKEVNNDYSKQDYWTKYGNITVMAGTIVFCLILVGVTVYYTYQHANQVVPALEGLSGALKSGGTIAGY